MACAASSITATPARPAVSVNTSISTHCPNRCTGIMALVRPVTTDPSCDTSILNVPGSISTNTGFAPSLTIEPTVAKNVKGVVITSSPGPTLRAIKGSKSASDPDAQPTANSHSQ